MVAREKNFRCKDDAFYITKFRTLHPEQVEEIRNEMKKEYPRATPETIEKHVDHEILPMVLEESTKNYGGGGDAVHLSVLGNLTHLECEAIVVRESSFGDYTVDKLHELLELLPEPEKAMIKMCYGLSPYEGVFSQEKISQELGISQQAVSKKLKRILKLLRGVMRDEFKKEMGGMGEE